MGDVIAPKLATCLPLTKGALKAVLSWLPRECLPARVEPVSIVEPRSTWLNLDGGEEAVEKLYSRGEKLGQGSFGKVFACMDLSTRADLCMKVVPLQGRKGERVAKVCGDSKREILCQRLWMDHPNIVKYHRFLQTAEALYTVMDRCLGPDLVDFVRDQGQQLPIDRIRDLSSQILSAVAGVHKMGIMHRDIKPENFRFKDVDATVLQLLDFGFAKPAPSEPTAHTITGTLLYAAPEVFDGIYDRKCDLWSAGVVLFQLFAGHPPFQTHDVSILCSLHHDPLLAGNALFRGPQWRQAPRLAQVLIRGLLTANPSERLDAEEACEHSWFRAEEGTDMGGGLGMGPRKSSSSKLKRDSSSISVKGLGEKKAGDLKRSYFVWDLAGAATDSSEELLPGA